MAEQTIVVDVVVSPFAVVEVESGLLPPVIVEVVAMGVPPGSMVTGGAITIGPTPPPNPHVNDVWIDTN